MIRPATLFMKAVCAQSAPARKTLGRPGGCENADVRQVLTWSPAASRFASTREHGFEQSTLTLADGYLHWTPEGMRRDELGSLPFSLSVASAEGRARELAWIHGEVDYVRRGTGSVDVLALCEAPAPAAPATATREVLAFLPVELLKPCAPASDAANLEDVLAAGAHAIAAAAGMEFTEFRPEFGTDVNRIFPGAMPGAGNAISTNLFLARTYLAAGIVTMMAAVFALAQQPINGRLVGVLLVIGTVLSVVGWSMFPSTRRRFRPRRPDAA